MGGTVTPLGPISEVSSRQHGFGKIFLLLILHPQIQGIKETYFLTFPLLPVCYYRGGVLKQILFSESLVYSLSLPNTHCVKIKGLALARVAQLVGALITKRF